MEQGHFVNIFKRLIPTLNRSLVEKIVPHTKNSAAGILLRQTSTKEPFCPYSLVADQLPKLANHIRSIVISKAPNLTSDAEYFFNVGFQRKQVRPTVLLLMAKSLNTRLPEPTPNELSDGLTSEQRLAVVTEMIHLASLILDDVLDNDDTKCGISSLNIAKRNKRTVFIGDFLYTQATRELASLENTEVNSLLSTTIDKQETGKFMKMDCTPEERCSMEYYMEMTYCKTASLMSNSCKAISLVAGQTTQAAKLAFQYGENLGMAYDLIKDVLDYTSTSASVGKGSLSDICSGIVTAPMLFAMEEFPQLRTIFDQGIDKPKNIQTALEYLDKSRGIQRTRELAANHANLAASVIDALPETDDENVYKYRRALKTLVHQLVTREKLLAPEEATNL